MLVRFNALKVTSLKSVKLVFQGFAGLLFSVTLLFWVLSYEGPVSEPSFSFRRGGLDKIIGLGIPISIAAIYLGMRAGMIQRRASNSNH